MKRLSKLTRRRACALIQLRSGHAPLASHLYRIGKATSPLCPACRLEPESVKHFLLACPRFAATRTRHFARLGRRTQSLGFLLGDPAATRALFAFINDSGRMRGTYGDLAKGVNLDERDETRTRHTQR
ncbi:hypothetical protein C8Q80DRAFT_1107945 [Daedaleopsis nitida]|nr:hypothetical protein C8Q80DRAFT_1107945 [Daedaleopsis nitida]